MGNPDPICLIDNKLKISVNEINKYNKKYDIYFIPNIGGTKSKDITDFKAFLLIWTVDGMKTTIITV